MSKTGKAIVVLLAAMALCSLAADIYMIVSVRDMEKLMNLHLPFVSTAALAALTWIAWKIDTHIG